MRGGLSIYFSYIFQRILIPDRKRVHFLWFLNLLYLFFFSIFQPSLFMLLYMLVKLITINRLITNHAHNRFNWLLNPHRKRWFWIAIVIRSAFLVLRQPHVVGLFHILRIINWLILIWRLVTSILRNWLPNRRDLMNYRFIALNWNLVAANRRYMRRFSIDQRYLVIFLERWRVMG